MTVIRCAKCGGEKTPICSKAGKPGSGYRCRPCWAAYMREYNKAPAALAKKKAGQRKRYRETIPERINEQLKRAYGIGKTDYDRMLAAQGGVCAICEQPQRGSRRLAVDHCHATGMVRGLLCSHCNYALGQARDNPNILRVMAAYLERGRPITDQSRRSEGIILNGND